MLDLIPPGTWAARISREVGCYLGPRDWVAHGNQVSRLYAGVVHTGVHCGAIATSQSPLQPRQPREALLFIFRKQNKTKKKTKTVSLVVIKGSHSSSKKYIFLKVS